MKIRKIKKIYYTSHFARAYRALSPDKKKQAELWEEYFRENVFDERLKTHKLKGKFKDFWSFSLTYSG